MSNAASLLKLPSHSGRCLSYTLRKRVFYFGTSHGSDRAPERNLYLHPSDTHKPWLRWEAGLQLLQPPVHKQGTSSIRV